MPGTRWSSHKDQAAKALRKLAGPHLPASLTKLEQAVKRAHTAFDGAERAHDERQRAECQAIEAEADDSTVDDELDDVADAAQPVRAVRGPTRHPRVARPDGRAGDGGSARAPGVDLPTKGDRRCLVASTLAR